MRSKASSESTALTASVRKEQMKNESLEQALQQKVKTPPLPLWAAFVLAAAASVLFHFVTLHPFLCHHRIKRLRNSQRFATS